MEKNTADQAEHLAAIAHFGAQQQEAEQRIRAHVLMARMTGASWVQIGNALGLSKQTAHARYGKDDAPAPSKISDPDVAGTSETPSIFSDAATPATAPAPQEYSDPRPGFVLASAGKIDGIAQPGTGKGPHQCTRCGSTNHKSSNDNAIRAYFDCTPTKYDPQDITDHLNSSGLDTK